MRILDSGGYGGPDHDDAGVAAQAKTMELEKSTFLEGKLLMAKPMYLF